MSRFIEVPARLLPPETLTALRDAFVPRPGPDPTETRRGMNAWVAPLHQRH